MIEHAADAVGVGVIGAGAISDQYLTALVQFPDVRVVMVSDLDVPRAEAQADKYGVPKFGTTDQLLADTEVEIVVNLTVPAAHASVSSQALRAGKHVWSEKPLSVDREVAAPSSRTPRRQAGCWPWHPTRSWAPECRPPSAPSTVATSAFR